MNVFTRTVDDSIDVFEQAQADTDETHAILCSYKTRGARGWRQAGNRVLAYTPTPTGFRVVTLEVGH